MWLLELEIGVLGFSGSSDLCFERVSVIIEGDVLDYCRLSRSGSIYGQSRDQQHDSDRKELPCINFHLSSPGLGRTFLTISFGVFPSAPLETFIANVT